MNQTMHPGFFSIALSCLLILALAGCSGSGEATNRDSNDANTITGDEISQETTTNIGELIQGRIPGVMISQTVDGRIVARMRGRSSFNGNDSPLFVLDGMPVEPNRDGSLPGVFVREIESIKVLKGPTETARYGMRGANGVIVVTTKIGKGN